MVALRCLHLFRFGDLGKQISPWKAIPERSVEGQASRSDARYLYIYFINGVCIFLRNSLFLMQLYHDAEMGNSGVFQVIIQVDWSKK